ncbi:MULTISPECIES: Rieske (2Fe-2S) protein [unclassified Streptomyces]|uniref:Rieske (2Fe-2S) protein n=1 Tax=unclassified Streptomyces TaxID=2593676 RepID=UPI00109ECEE7|nr:Rieske (2Fe-2S) protein [Streptomyces sp. A1136]THA52635.1 Rieske (2Fe-2S) protein [Streptomyces sp. A1136]
MSEPTPAARRTVLAAGAVALAGGTLAACGSDDKPKGDSGSAPAPESPASAPASAAPSSGGAGKTLLKSSAVPVGGGTILKAEKLVVTQPTAGSFRCFTAVCTHQGCIVGTVANGTIDCPCHGSKFKIADGAVAHGPATRPLAEQRITVAPDGDISLA